MGVGNLTTEELLFDENGRLLTDGTWEYKPPCSKSIPKVSNLSYPFCKCIEYKLGVAKLDYVINLLNVPHAKSKQ